MENNETKKKLRSAAIKAAGTVTAAGMLLNAAVEPEDLLTSPEQKAQSASSAHVQHGSAPVYTVKGTKAEPVRAPTRAEGRPMSTASVRVSVLTPKSRGPR